MVGSVVHAYYQMQSAGRLRKSPRATLLAAATKWGAITVGLCPASVLIPLPFLRIVLASVIAFVAMMVVKSRGRH
jgi:hypothetical protein